MPLLNDSLVFALPPKTGSSWVERIVKEADPSFACKGGNRHQTQFVDKFAKEGRLSVTTIRNPFDWLESLFRYQRMNGYWLGVPGAAAVLNGLRSETFEEFVGKVVERPGIVGYVFESYIGLADEVMRTETLRDDLERVLAKAGLGVENKVFDRIRRENVSDRSIPCRWTEDLRSALRESERDFFERYYRSG